MINEQAADPPGHTRLHPTSRHRSGLNDTRRQAQSPSCSPFCRPAVAPSRNEISFSRMIERIWRFLEGPDAGRIGACVWARVPGPLRMVPGAEHMVVYDLKPSDICRVLFYFTFLSKLPNLLSAQRDNGNEEGEREKTSERPSVLRGRRTEKGRHAGDVLLR